MKNLIMWDSCECIRWMRDNSLKEIILPAPVGFVSAIVVAELLVSIHKHVRSEIRRKETEHFLSGMTVLPFDANAAGHYADIRAHLEKSGTTIGPMDLLIAAHARSRGATLFTANAREFRRVPGLKIIAP